MADNTFVPVDGLGLLAQYGIKQPEPPGPQGPPMPTDAQMRGMEASEIARKGNEAEPGRYEVVPENKVEDWQKQWREKEASSGFAGDAQRLVRMGANSMLLGVREAVRSIPKVGPSIVGGLDAIDKWATGKDSETILKENVAYHEARLTPEMQAARKKEFVTETKGPDGKVQYGMGPAWTDPRTYAAALFESAAPTAASMIPGGVLARGAYLRAIAGGASKEAAAAAAARAALIGGAVSEGIIGGGQTAYEVREQINKLPEDVLATSEAYQELLKAGKTPQEARAAIADDAAVKGLLLAGTATAMFGGQGDRVLAKLIAEGTQGGLGKRILSGAARGAVAEGLLEELPQSVGEKLAENYAMQGADPRRTLTEGVPNAAVSGAVTGGIMGAGFGGVGGAASQAEPPAAPKGPLRQALEYGIEKANERDARGAGIVPPPAPPAAPPVQATGPTPPDAGLPGAGESVMVQMDDGSTFPARVETYSNGEVIVADQMTGELLQVPPSALRLPTPEQYAAASAAQADAPQPEPPTETTVIPNTGRTVPVERAPDGPPEAGKNVIVTQPDGTKATGRVGGYTVDEATGEQAALVKTPQGELQVPLSQMAVSAMSKKEIAREDAKLNPPVQRDIPTTPTMRKVGRANMELPDEIHARLYDLGKARVDTAKMLGKGTMERDRVSPSEQTALAQALGVAERELGQIADDYRYRVDRAARTANSDLPIKMQPVNAKLLERKRAESAKAAEESGKGTAESAPAGDVSPAAPAPAPIDEAAKEAATSPTNDTPQPTEAQKEAGNYKKGHVRLAGLDISIENPEGSTRSGTDKRGKAWSVKMKSHYGYIKGTKGKDKDHLDVFIRPGVDAVSDEAMVYVIDQRNPDGKFDEHKIMIGYTSPEEAERAYLANYSKGWKGLGDITEITMGELKAWLASGDTTKPFAARAEKIQPPNYEAAENTAVSASPAPQAAPTPDKTEPVKWFGARDRAEAYMAKKKLTGSHEIVEASKGRFEVRPKASVEPGSTPSAGRQGDEAAARQERLDAEAQKNKRANDEAERQAKGIVARLPDESDPAYFMRMRDLMQRSRSGASYRAALAAIAPMVGEAAEIPVNLPKIRRASITVASTPLGWTWGSAMTMPGDLGSFGFTARDVGQDGQYYRSRQDAVTAAALDLRQKLAGILRRTDQPKSIMTIAEDAIAALDQWGDRTIGNANWRSNEAKEVDSQKTPAAAPKAPVVSWGNPPDLPDSFGAGGQLARAAQSYVVANGKRDNVEYLLVFSAEGKVLLHGKGSQANTGFTAEAERVMDDPLNYPLVAHHNHPSNRSFSLQDLAMLATPGLGALWAHGHNGAYYRAALRKEAAEALRADPGALDETANSLVALLRAVIVRIEPRITKLGQVYIDASAPDAADERFRLANAAHHEILSRALHMAGLIEYNSSQPAEIANAVDDIAPMATLEEIANEISQAFYQQAIRPDWNDRRTLAAGFPGDMGVSFEGASWPPAVAGEGRAREARAQDNRREAEAVGVTPAAPAAEAKPSDGQFAKNTLFTADKVAAARARLRAKMNQLNSGIDPEVLVDGMTIAGAYIESGIRSFAEYAAKMKADFGDSIVPYLLSFWEGARNYPGLDTAGMTSPDDSRAQHAKLMSGADLTEVKPVIGETAAKPEKRKRKTGASSDMVLTQDWGVEHIDGYGTSPDRETGNETKDAFLRESRSYLSQVAAILTERGYQPHADRGGKTMKPVSVNEAGPAVSGEVSLIMFHPDGGGVYVQIGASSLRGVVPTTPSGVAIMYRRASQTDRYGSKGINRWAPVDLSAADFAELIDREGATAAAGEPRRKTPENAPDSGAKAPNNEAKAPSNDRSAPSSAPPVPEAGAEPAQGVMSDLLAPPAARQEVRDDARTDEADPAGRDQGSGAGGVQPVAGDGATASAGQPGGGRADGVAGGSEGGTGRGREDAGQPVLRADDAAPASEPRDGDEVARGDRAGTGAVRPAGESRGDGTAAAARPNRPVSAVGQNHRIEPGAIKRTGSWRDTAERNVEIVELVKRLEADKRRPTPDEAALLTRFTGWGASEIANNIFGDRSGQFRPGWEGIGARLKAALTPEEYAQAKRTTQYAHYTGEDVIRPIYTALERMGFTGGRVLEPGMGVGLFNGLMPAGMASGSRYTGIEFDTITGSIAKLLYPQSDIIVGDYTKTPLPRDYFDLAIGNPPFGSIVISNDPEYKKNGFMIHDYFFAKTIDRVKPGGLLVFVTSKGTMDKANDVARRYLAARANLVGAIRLPQTAFQQNAGTEVVTDIIFLQKRGGGVEDNGVPWKALAEVDTPSGKTLVNEYFAANPQMVLGRHAMTGSMYRAETYTVEPDKSRPFEDQIADAVARLPESIVKVPTGNAAATEAAVIERDYNPKNRKEGGLYLSDDGALMVLENGAGVPMKTRTMSDGKTAPLKDREIAFLSDWVKVRDALKVAYKDQLTDGPWETSLAALRKTYDEFVKKHGRLREFSTIERTDADGEVTVSKRYKNDPLLRLDVEGVLAHALEKIDEVAGTISPDKVLSERVLEKRQPPQIKTVQDALFVSLDAKGALDIDDVARLAGVSRQDAIATLGAEIYETPSGTWETADRYLSGDVRKKLKDAQAAAALDRRFARNVEGLLAVQPRPLGPAEISVNLGQNWIAPKHISAFAQEIMGERLTIRYLSKIARWTVDAAGSSYGEFNTPKMSAADILDAVLNNREIKITQKDPEGKTFVDTVSTEAAIAMANKMKEAFRSWVWTDKERADELVSFYNENFNNIAPRKFDGSHLTLPGVTSRLELRPHQKRAIWRAVQEGDTYLAHAVGAGKTYTMIASGMEERRLGLSTKPMYVVPNHMLAQFSREFLELYPAANIMVADEQNFHTGNRRRFVAQAALNNPDAIIITHSAFGRLPMSDEFAARFIEAQIAEWQDALLDVDKSDRITLKQIQRQIEQLERRLEARQGDKDKKDRVMTFEELGVDRLFVDEGHEFRKLDFPTNQGRIKGIDPAGSQRAMDLHMKVQYLRKKKPGRALVMASGTPITNTMGELFTVQRLFQPDQLAEDNHSSFDAWANHYGAVASGFEQNAAGGYEIVARFAKFMNVPELMRRVRSFMDILTSSDLGALVKRPNVRGGGRDVIVTDVPDGYKQYQASLQSRIAAIKARKGKVQKGDDIILSVIADGRFSAIDMRFVDPRRPSDPKSKLNRTIDDVIAAYKATADNVYYNDGQPDPLKGSSILLFSDIGLGEQSAQSRGFDMRAWIEKRLTDAGIPSDHIAFMRDHKAHAKKERLFADMREGKKRILIGGKDMETGVNVQKRLAWLGHLDAPWFPASVEQREGRIIRQGNQNAEITIKAYATKGSYDSTMWGMNARKARFIEQAMTGDETVRSLEDVSEASAFEVAAALASGDERYLKMAGLKADYERLERLAQAHHDDQRKLSSSKHTLEQMIAGQREEMAKIEKALERRQVIRPGAFEAKIGGKVFDNREEWSNALFKRAQVLIGESTVTENGEKIGEIGGFPVLFKSYEVIGSYRARVDVDAGVPTEAILIYPFEPDIAINGLATKAANIVNSLDRRLDQINDSITDAQRKIKQIDDRLGAPFPEQAAMIEKFGELQSLQAELAAEKAAEGAAMAEAAAAAAEIEAPVVWTIAPERKLSTGAAGQPSGNPGQLRAELAAHPLGALVAPMIASGRVSIVDGAVAGVPATAHGWTDPDGTIVLRTNIPPGDAMAVLMHEAFHAGARGLLGKAEWTTLMRSLRPVYRQMQAGSGKAKAFHDAFMAVRNAEQAEGRPMTEAQRLEEFAAYAIENREAAPRSLAIWIDNLLGQVKAWVLRTFGRQAGAVTPGQLRAIAIMAMRDMAHIKDQTTKAGRRYAIAYHGTPHAFDRFSLEGIGSGEGNQSFGWGLYFASNKEIAEHYRKKLSALATLPQGNELRPGEHDISAWVEYVSDAVDNAKMAKAFGVSASSAEFDQRLDDAINEAADLIMRGRTDRAPAGSDEAALIQSMRDAGWKFATAGSLYTVNVPNEDQLLDWDLPVDEQPPGVRQKLAAAGLRAQDYARYTVRETASGAFLVVNPWGETVSRHATRPAAEDSRARRQAQHNTMGGAALYSELKSKLGSDKAASLALRDAGIPGLRYLDGASRGSSAGSHNYVIFDDTQIEVREARRFSIAMPKREDAVRAVRGKLTDLTPAMLAAIPLNYFSELRRPSMTAVDQYLDIKRAMDTYRGNKHEAADKISQEWLDYSKLGIGADGKAKAAVLAELMHDSTLAGVDPSMGYDQFTNGVAPEAYEGLRARWNKLPAKAQALYETVRDAYKAQSEEMDRIILANVKRAMEIAAEQAQKDYLREVERIQRSKTMSPLDKAAALEDAKKARAQSMQRSQWADKARLTRLRAEFESTRMKGPYFPLARFGRYFVSAKDVDGEVLSFQRFENAADMDKAAEEMRALTGRQFPGATVEFGVLDEPGSMRQAMDPRLVAQVETILAGASVDPSVMDAIWQRYLMTLPEMSIRKRQIHRKGTAGFEKDALRVFSNHMFHAAHQMARMKYGLELQEALNKSSEQARTADDPVRASTLINEMRKRHEWVMNPTGSQFAQRVTSAMFAWYLAASPASALVNITQTAIVGLPILGARLGGMGKATVAVMRAMGDFASGKGSAANSRNLSSQEKEAMAAFYESGLIDRTRSHDLAGVGNTGTEYSPLRHRIMEKLAWMFHQAEVLNREVTALAAYRLARAKGENHQTAINTAHELTWKTHFDYSNSNRPRIMQSDFAKVALVFQNFQINMWYRFFRDFHQSFKGETPAARREARYQLAGIMGMLTLLGGVSSIFGFKALMAIAGLLLDDEDDPRKFEEELKNAIIKQFGPDIGAMIVSGVPGRLMNIDLASRIGMPDFLIRTRDSNKEGREAGLEWMAALFGASASTVLNAFDGAHLISEGKVVRGIEVMAPKAIKDLMQAYRFANDGLENRRGATVMERDDLSFWDIASKAMGFTSGRISETYSRNRELAGAERRVLEDRKLLIEAWATARMHDDTDARKRAMEKIAEFNQRPFARGNMRITAETLARSLAVRKRNDTKREDGVVIESKSLDRFIRGGMPERTY